MYSNNNNNWSSRGHNHIKGSTSFTKKLFLEFGDLISKVALVIIPPITMAILTSDIRVNIRQEVAEEVLQNIPAIGQYIAKPLPLFFIRRRGMSLFPENVTYVPWSLLLTYAGASSKKFYYYMKANRLLYYRILYNVIHHTTNYINVDVYIPLPRR